MIGQDSNAQIGKCNETHDDGELKSDFTGRHGLDRRCAKGEELVEFLQANDLFAMNMFYEAKAHATHKSFNKEGSLHQIDHFIGCSEKKKLALSCRVDNTTSVASDYNSISLKLSIVANDRKIKPKSHVNWIKLIDSLCRVSFNEHLKEIACNYVDLGHGEFCRHMVKGSAKVVCETKVEHKGWV